MQELQEFVRYILLRLEKKAVLSSQGDYLFSGLRMEDGEAYFKS